MFILGRKRIKSTFSNHGFFFKFLYIIIEVLVIISLDRQKCHLIVCIIIIVIVGFFSQITFDTPYFPETESGRVFDYVEMAQALDFYFIMAYDMSGQGKPWANCPINATEFGKNSLTRLLIFQKIKYFSTSGPFVAHL